MKKERLDKILTDLNYFENKSKASAAILSASVKINGEVITKSGFQINPETIKTIEVKNMPFVSRGGLKLKTALDKFIVNPKERVCLDAGASTGGFTDCLLQNGAKFVYAVDVGYGQLAWKIRNDERVKTIERTNIRNCQLSDIYSESETIANLLVSDLSFISLKKVLPNFKNLLAQDFHEMICLIKPQFEAGKDFVDKGGVVKNPNIHIEVIDGVIEFANELDYSIADLTYSSIKGPSGNIEYLIHITTDKSKQKDILVKSVVNEAFAALN